MLGWFLHRFPFESIFISSPTGHYWKKKDTYIHIHTFGDDDIIFGIAFSNILILLRAEEKKGFFHFEFFEDFKRTAVGFFKARKVILLSNRVFGEFEILSQR